MNKVRYLESRLVQWPATEWLQAQWGFVEARADDEALGADLDSIGTIGDRFFLIEYKAAVSGSGVTAVPPRSGTIEAKFLRFLGRLYRYGSEPDVADALAIWDQLSNPVLTVCAGSYSASGLERTSSMLAALSQSLRTDWQVWRWDGEEVRVEASGEGPSDDLRDRTSIVVPVALPTPARPRPSLGKLQATAEQRGVGELFAGILALAKSAGLRQTVQQTGVAMKRVGPDRTTTQAVVTVFVNRAEPDHGIPIGYDRSLFSKVFPSLPESPSQGFLNDNCWIGALDDFRSVLAALKD